MPPSMLFLTHVHLGPRGGRLPERGVSRLIVAASARASAIMARPTPGFMEKLSENVVPLVADLPGIDEKTIRGLPFRPPAVDTVVEDGQVVELDDDLTVTVMATPGHTRDHMSYYIPEKRILVATEACGVLDRAGNVATEFIVDYDAYVASLKRLAALPVDILCQGHHFAFVGADEVRAFFARSLDAAERLADTGAGCCRRREATRKRWSGGSRRHNGIAIHR